MPRLAIVISAVGSIESLEGTLVSVLENRPADCEIAVVLNRPYADPYDLAEEVRFIEPRASQSITEGINRALAGVRAPFVHLLASGCLASEGWVDAALARFGDRRVGSVAPIVWEDENCQRILAAGVGYRRWGRRYLVGAGLSKLDPETQRAIVGPCGFAAFYRKAALDFVGGFSTRLGPRQADADVALVLRQAGFTAALEPDSRLRATAAVDVGLGAFRESLYDERLFRRNLVGPGQATALVAHWARTGLEVAGAFGRPRMVSQMAGRLLGCVGSYGRHHRALAELAGHAMSAAPAGQVRIDRSHDAPTRAEASRRGVRAH